MAGSLRFNPFRVDKMMRDFPSVATRRRNAGLKDGIPLGFKTGAEYMDSDKAEAN